MDTARKRSDLLVLLADNLIGAISPQDIRDLVLSVTRRYTATSAELTYTMSADEDLLLSTGAGTGAVTVTLPSSEVISGRVYDIKDAAGNAGTNNITIATEGAETIDGSATLVLDTNYASATLVSDGTNWFIA